MLYCDENNDTVLVDSLHQPIVSRYMWILDLQLQDFTLSEITSLEEVSCTTLQLTTNGFSFNIPSHWYVLIYDPETCQLDAISLAESAGRDFKAFVFGPKKTVISNTTVSITDYYSNKISVYPSIPKGGMLCHPISIDSWIMLSPVDVYNKYLKNIDISDII